jgi:hypothetical protein
MPKLVMMPPQNDQSREYARRLREALPEYQIVVPETEDEARHEIADADAAYGWVSPELLPLAHKLRWLRSPHVAPPAGYYYPALIAHPVVVCNPRGIFNDTYRPAYHDVFEIEPLPPGYRLWTLPKSCLRRTSRPRTRRTSPNGASRLLDNAHRFAANEPLRNVVDKAVWY